MLKFLVGPLLVGAAYAAGSVYGADAEQVVHKDPSTTYAAIDEALATMKRSGTTSFEGGTPVPYEVEVARTPSEKIVITLLFSGAEGAQAELAFTPQNGGRDTLIQAHIHAHRDILRPVLSGTNKARLAYAPDWMLNLCVKPLLKQLAGEIESNDRARIDDSDDGGNEARWEANLSVEERGEVAQWREEEATRPSVDPDAAARNYEEANSN